jgi:serine/threonine protein kinase/CheY-like chemotaxis protein
VPARILIIDPRSDRRRTVSGALAPEGYQVLAASTLQQAVDHLTVDHFDLVVICEEPGALDAKQAVATVRKRKNPRQLGIVVLAATPGEPQEIDLLHAGASDVLRLPPKLALLAARVRAELAARLDAAQLTGEIGEEQIGPGTILDGKYALGDMIGVGGFGRVYRAHHIHLDRPVAVKVLQSSHAWSAKAVRRFQLEGSATCKVDDPHAVQVFDFGLGPGGIPYLVMELLEGKTLFDVLDQNRGKLLEVRRVAEIMAPVCEMLQHAHSVGLMHRDINPSNIFLDVSSGTEVVKVLDFGVAKFFDSRERLTDDGVVLGVPHYTAPERHKGQEYGAPADAYSVGVVLFELLTDGYPFKYDTEAPMEVALAPLTQTPARLADRRPEVPPELDAVVARLLRVEPSERPSLAEVIQVLRGILEPSAPARRAPVPTPLWVSPVKER